MCHHPLNITVIVEDGCQTNCCLVFLLNSKESSSLQHRHSENKLRNLLPGSPVTAPTSKVHLTELTYC